MISCQYFSPAEFWNVDKYGNPMLWWDHMSEHLMRSADIVRFRWTEYCRKDAAILISPAEGAIGRQAGTDSKSDHNVDYWGRVCAFDCFPRFLRTRDQWYAFESICRDSGITSLGLYPDWVPPGGDFDIGVHLGVTPGRALGDMATWGAVDKQVGSNLVQTYVDMDTAIKVLA